MYCHSEYLDSKALCIVRTHAHNKHVFILPTQKSDICKKSLFFIGCKLRDKVTLNVQFAVDMSLFITGLKKSNMNIRYHNTNP